MTVIAWDGTMLVADRRSSTADRAYSVRKLHDVLPINRPISLGRMVVGFTGDLDKGIKLKRLVEDGLLDKEWPDFQKTDAFCNLIILSRRGINVYEREPIGLEFFDTKMAWGSGGDAALGAMAHGANAIEAVRAACKVIISCGPPMDGFSFDSNGELKSHFWGA